MPKRPRSHKIEDLSITQLVDAFTEVGWTIESLKHDYGEGLLIRIFEDGQATSLSFYIQAKFTDNLDEYLIKNGNTISYPVHSGHVSHWHEFWEPVFITVWDSVNDVTYWQCVQSYLDRSSHDPESLESSQTLNIHIPRENVLNHDGIRRIKSITKDRFSRFQKEQEGAEVLVEALKDAMGIDIEYDSQAGVLILPPGKFVREDEGNLTVFFFGKTAARLEEIKSNLDMDTEEALNSSLDFMMKVISVFSEERGIELRDQNDKAIKEWSSWKNLKDYIRREQEIEEGEL